MLDEDNILKIESIFLSLEEDYVNQLLVIPEFHLFLNQYFKYSNKELVTHFAMLQEKMDRGEVKEEEEDKIELSMIACVLAMSENIKKLIKVKTPNYENKGNNGRTR